MKLPAQQLLRDGLPQLGFFADSVADADGRHEASLDAFGQPRAALAKALQYKQFQYFGGMSERFIFGCALVDLGYCNTVFAYLFDTNSGELFSRSVKRPGHLGMSLSSSPVSGISRFQAGDLTVEQTYEGEPRCKSLSLRIGDELSLRARMPEAGFEPMSLCTRAGYHGWVYANKTAGLALEGELIWRSQRHDLAELGAMGHHDFSCGFMRRETWWNWACLSGIVHDSVGQSHALGLNISTGVNETTYSENCLWLNGQCISLASAHFEFNARDVLKPWQVSTLDGRVQLQFTPLGLHQEKLKLPLLKSHFRQIFGRFQGRVEIDGACYTVQGLTGFVEDQFVRW